jgi:hypothetical protein
MAHTKEQLARLEETRLEEKSKQLEMLRNELPFSAWSDAVFGNFLIGILTRDEGVHLRAALKSFEGDEPPLREAILQLMKHPRLKPLMPH